MVRFAQIYKCLSKDTISFQINWMQNFGTSASTLKEEMVTITCNKKQLCAKHVDGFLFGLPNMIIKKITITEDKLGIVLWSNNHPFFHLNGFEESGSEDILENSTHILKIKDLINSNVLDSSIPIVIVSYNPSSYPIRKEFLSSNVVMLPYSNYSYYVTAIEIGSLIDPITNSAADKKSALIIHIKYPPLALEDNKNG